MIAEMKKHAFLVFHQDYQDFLLKLGNLGVLHVIENESEKEKVEILQEKEAELDRLHKVLDILETFQKDKETESKDDFELEEPKDMLSRVEELESSLSDLETVLEETNKEIRYQLPWGDYDSKDLEKLIEAGYFPKFYQIPKQQFDPAWEEMGNLFVITRETGYIYFIVLLKGDEEDVIHAESVKPIDKSLSELKNDSEKIKDEIENAKNELSELSLSMPEALKKEKNRLESEISILRVYQETQSASEDTLRILEGWVPDNLEDKLAELVEKENVVNITTVPDKGEAPPVQLKNDKFSRLFEPISNLFDLPSYRELDLTPFFAPFFVLFFGFCLGDAGYGVFFIIFASILKLKADKKLKPILSLAQFLGIGTILFGLLSGTFFGINLIDSGYTLTAGSLKQIQNSDVPAPVAGQLKTLEGEYFEERASFLEAVGNQIGEENLNKYEQQVVKSAVAGIPLVGKFRYMMQDSLTMFYLALLIGAFQILFGIFIRILNITKRKGFKYSLSTIGWLILIITLIIYYLEMFGTQALTYLFYGLLGISGILIFFLNDPDKNIFARFGSGIWDSYNMVTGLFGDLLSYVRLFALGISSAILGFVFNDISLQLLNVPYVGWLLFLILLIFGHSINLFMATLGGFIHPMRLIFVEFYKNAGFKGGGKKYKPFIINNN